MKSASRPLLFRCRHHTFRFPRPALVMGIVNVTPDSFSDGGRYFDAAAAIEHGLRLARDGAEILDVGGESTRPGSVAVPEGEELRRVLPVVEALAARSGVAVSIDTQKPGVARAALAAGASLLNDIAANRSEESMWALAAGCGAGYVAMHMQGTPATMQLAPAYEDVVEEVGHFFEDRLTRLERAGLRRDQVALDPGIGFGKTTEHSLELLGRVANFLRFERPIVLGVSRKSFLGSVSGADVHSRLPAGLACTVWAALQGVSIFRTHDVLETVQALRMMEAVSVRAA